MSTEINTGSDVLEESEIELTQFWGGVCNGICVQVTQPMTSDGFRFIQLTPLQAREVAKALVAWADTKTAAAEMP